MEGRVGVSRYADNQVGPPRLGNAGEMVVSPLNPKYYEHTVRGNMFSYTTALAGNALVAATTTNAPAIWNPAGSGKNLVIVQVRAARTAKGTPLEGSIVYLTLSAAGSGIGTGSQVISLTEVAPVNCLVGSGARSVMRFAPTTISTTGTPTIICTAGFAQTADNGATTVSGPRAESLIDYVEGAIVVPPGNTFQLGAAVSISTTYTFTILGLELPLPAIA